MNKNPITFPKLTYNDIGLIRFYSNALNIFQQLPADNYSPKGLALITAKLMKDTADGKVPNLPDYLKLMEPQDEPEEVTQEEIKEFVDFIMALDDDEDDDEDDENDKDDSEQAPLSFFDSLPADAVPICHSADEADDKGDSEQDSLSFFDSLPADAVPICPEDGLPICQDIDAAEALESQASPAADHDLTQEVLDRLFSSQDDREDEDKSETQAPVFPWDNPVGSDSTPSIFDQLAQAAAENPIPADDDDEDDDRPLTGLAKRFQRLTQEMGDELTQFQVKLWNPDATNDELCRAMNTCLNRLRPRITLLRGMVSGAWAVDQKKN